MSRVAADAGRLVYVGNLPDDIREREVGIFMGAGPPRLPCLWPWAKKRGRGSDGAGWE